MKNMCQMLLDLSIDNDDVYRVRPLLPLILILSNCHSTDTHTVILSFH